MNASAAWPWTTHTTSQQMPQHEKTDLQTFDAWNTVADLPTKKYTGYMSCLYLRMCMMSELFEMKSGLWNSSMLGESEICLEVTVTVNCDWN